MPHHRFYHPDLTHLSIEIEDKEFHHMKHVMRLKENEMIELVDGKGHLAIGQIHKMDRVKAVILIVEKKIFEKPKIPLAIAIAATKPAHLDLALEKMTEIGVDEIFCYETHYSEKNPKTPAQIHRIEQILIAAMKQCGRVYLPKIHYYEGIENLPLSYPQAFYCHFDPQGVKVADVSIENKETLILIGPEKGFSEKDVKGIQHHLKGRPITLGPYILRAETAAIIASGLFVNKLAL
jgi:16S rRNA (uracil1498-N3)-methyltransferase